jgi:hypothetical protein
LANDRSEFLGEGLGGVSTIDRLDILPPKLKFGLSLVERESGFIGNIVDGSAEGIKRGHGLSLFAREADKR